MKLRFAINQTAAFRHGVNAPTSIADIEVDPAALSREQREAIADRLNGIEVHELGYPEAWNPKPKLNKLVVADGPAFEHLWDAILANEADIAKHQKEKAETEERLLREAIAALQSRKTRTRYINYWDPQLGCSISYEAVEPAHNFDSVDKAQVPGLDAWEQELDHLNQLKRVEQIVKVRGQLESKAEQERAQAELEASKKAFVQEWLERQGGELLEQYKEGFLDTTEALEAIEFQSGCALPPPFELETCADRDCPCGSVSLKHIKRELYSAWKALKASLPAGVTLSDPCAVTLHSEVVRDEYGDPDANAKQPAHLCGTLTWTEGPLTFKRTVKLD